MQTKNKRDRSTWGSDPKIPKKAIEVYGSGRWLPNKAGANAYRGTAPNEAMQSKMAESKDWSVKNWNGDILTTSGLFEADFNGREVRVMPMDLQKDQKIQLLDSPVKAFCNSKKQSSSREQICWLLEFCTMEGGPMSLQGGCRVVQMMCSWMGRCMSG